ncbi:MAG: NADH:flavin oxidoreductase [Alphaproteobacteria bacterium]
MTPLETCFAPAALNGLTLKNRFIKAATFENRTPQGVPGQAMQDFHGTIADGGIAMTTLAYCAVENAGRLNENMMVMEEAIAEPLAHLIGDLHKRGAHVSGQMAHCGGFSKNATLGFRDIRGPSLNFNSLGATKGKFISPAMSAADIEALIETYGRAAQFMAQVGFDAVEIHFGHGYGLHQFISPRTNRRADKYGDSFENRMRLPLAVLAKVRAVVGDDFPIIGKISLTEGVKGGMGFDDAVAVARALDQGGIDGIVTSGGTSTRNPAIMFRGGNLLPGMIAHEKSAVMRAVLRAAKPVMFPEYPYEDLYFRDGARRVREAVECAVIYVGGASNNDSFAQLMADGFDFIQLGRTLLSDPDLVNRAAADPDFRARCIHCNDCVGTIESAKGAHCPRF